MSAIVDLRRWLLMNKGDVLAQFAELTGAVVRGSGDEAFVYVPGARADRVLLVAHADTYWDNYDIPYTPVLTDGVFHSGSEERGLGADDRAGCAILWCLRGLGHSLLVTSGEEKGALASRFVICGSENDDVANEINAGHQFVVQFDRRNAREFKCYDVGTDEFRQYCVRMTGYTEPDRRSATDICVLCKKVCGVNLSVGYYKEHTPEEYLVLKEWCNTLQIARRWMSARELPRFALGNEE